MDCICSSVDELCCGSRNRSVFYQISKLFMGYAHSSHDKYKSVKINGGKEYDR